MKTENKKSKNQSGSEQKRYIAPKLTHHGLVTKVTAGGTGSAQEGSSGQRPRM